MNPYQPIIDLFDQSADSALCECANALRQSSTISDALREEVREHLATMWEAHHRFLKLDDPHQVALDAAIKAAMKTGIIGGPGK